MWCFWLKRSLSSMICRFSQAYNYALRANSFVPSSFRILTYDRCERGRWSADSLEIIKFMGMEAVTASHFLGKFSILSLSMLQSTSFVCYVFSACVNTSWLRVCFSEPRWIRLTADKFVLAWVQQSSVQWLKTNLPLETEVKFILKYYCEIQHRVFSRLQIGCQLWIFVTCRSVASIYNYIKKKKTYQFCNRFRKGEIWRWIETLKDIW